MLVQKVETADVVSLIMGLERVDLQYAEWCMTQEGMAEEGRLEYEKWHRDVVKLLAFLWLIDRTDPEVRFVVNDLRRALLIAGSHKSPHKMLLVSLDVKAYFHELLGQIAPAVSMLAFEVL